MSPSVAFCRGPPRQKYFGQRRRCDGAPFLYRLISAFIALYRLLSLRSENFFCGGRDDGSDSKRQNGTLGGASSAFARFMEGTLLRKEECWALREAGATSGTLKRGHRMAVRRPSQGQMGQFRMVQYA